MKKTKNKGFFITFEGLDGSGKTTIIKKIFNLLQKKYKNKVFVTREPGGSNNKIGEQIRKIILSNNNNEMTPITEAFLFAASRAQHVNDFIYPHLQKNHIILCDRFLHSSLVYQGYAKNIGFRNIYKINRFAIKGIMPNLIFLLLLNSKICLKRIVNDSKREKNRLDNQKMQVHDLIYKGYLKMLKKYPKNLVVINADQSITNIFNDIKNVLLKKLAKNYD